MIKNREGRRARKDFSFPLFRRKARKYRGLQARMTTSYVWVTVALVLVLECLNVALLTGNLSFSASQETAAIAAKDAAASVEQRAQIYALEAALLAHGSALDPRTTFQPGQPTTLAPPDARASFDLPYSSQLPFANQKSAVGQHVGFALLIMPDGHIAASTDAQHYPGSMPAAALLPDKKDSIVRALKGIAASTADLPATGSNVWAVKPVSSRDHTFIGAVYVQEPVVAIPLPLIVSYPLQGALVIFLLLLLLAPLVGSRFGMMTTHGLIGRVHNLVLATTRVANGDYTRLVEVSRPDEIGQLEQQFNRMAQQLAESIAQRQALAAQNARLAERARISRELHDAISQDLFSLRMLTDGLHMALPEDSRLQPHIATLEHTTTNMTREMRALLLEMRPARLEHLGLSAAIEDLAATYRERLGITVITTLSATPLNPRIEHTLLRIAQEALSNAVRHASATVITLSLVPREDMVILLVEDNGKGFSPLEYSSQHGLGLQLMQERVRELRGSFVLESIPGRGTRISVCLQQEEGTY